MKKYEKSIRLDRAGVDDASETIHSWLEEAGVKKYRYYPDPSDDGRTVE